jgi:DNA-binding transcriptional ArsR family regulator
VAARLTRIPKVYDLVLAGVPTEVILTYCALADHSNNKTGLCWPRMDTLARRLSRGCRTIQRHLHLLREKGLVEFVERRRDWHGRFGAYLYRVLHVVAAAGRKTAERLSRKERREKTPHHRTRGPVASNYASAPLLSRGELFYALGFEHGIWHAKGQ